MFPHLRACYLTVITPTVYNQNVREHDRQLVGIGPLISSCEVIMPHSLKVYRNRLQNVMLNVACFNSSVVQKQCCLSQICWKSASEEND